MSFYGALVLDIQYVKLFELIPREARREIIRILVEEAGLAKSEIARLMGVTPSAITRFLRGDAAPSPEHLASLYSKLTDEERLLVLHVVVDVVKQLLQHIEHIARSVKFRDGSLYARLVEASIDEIVDIATRLLEAFSGVQRGSVITSEFS